ncbi:MAG: ATP-binding protein [Deltaproteobacteria bacterium]|nr:ATP-binding protein [Deltaproteobacteria bacterium]
MQAYEKLGVFYLGKAFDVSARKRSDELILYDSKDLLTHAVIIGMTGSGKTGLGIGLLEEALIDHIPVIAIDPKGDLPNLLLGFPDLLPADFRPWVQPGDAARQGLSLEQFAEKTAAAWRKGLADWDQDPERIARLRAAADFAVYTPGSTAGLPVNVLRSFAPPPPETRSDADLFRERIQSTVTALLTLLGIEADAITSREHILMSTIFEQAWGAGSGLDLAKLIRSIQQPPLERVGVMDLESFYPARERFQLALRLNNLLAAPGFEAWLTGDPLDIGRMLHTSAGKPRALIFSISHLSDGERMFFTALLLNEILGWMRTQSGTASLRAILYMDEIYGFFPPVRNPPAKSPLLTLLKQARAFGLGVVLSTQNPVDLDYKGLANTGTWFIGRLQTENDKRRVLAGLDGAAAGARFDRQRVGEILSGLGKRVFLLHNVHNTEPVVFETRWVMSYLSGPMTREQIKALCAGVPVRQAPVSCTPGAAPPPVSPSAVPMPGNVLPPLPPTDVAVFYIPASGAGQGLAYVPAVGGWIDVHYRNSRYGIDVNDAMALAAPIADAPLPVDWDQALEIGAAPDDLASSPLPGAVFTGLPAAASRAGDYKKWRNDMLRWVRQNRALILHQSKRFKMASFPGETEGAFRARLAQAAREQRDLEVERLRRKYAEKYAVLQDRRMRADQVLVREQEQAKAKKVESVISFGTAILGAFLGRRTVSSGSVARVGSAIKSAGRLNKEQMDVAQAQETMAVVNDKIADLEARLQNDVDLLDAAYDPGSEPLEEVRLNPRSTDIALRIFGLLWLPYRKDAGGRMVPDWS